MRYRVVRRSAQSRRATQRQFRQRALDVRRSLLRVFPHEAGGVTLQQTRHACGRTRWSRHIRLVETASSAPAFSSVSLILQAAAGHDADFSGFAA
jgi:hypothetical protein